MCRRGTFTDRNLNVASGWEFEPRGLLFGMFTWGMNDDREQRSSRGAHVRTVPRVWLGGSASRGAQLRGLPQQWEDKGLSLP